MEGLPRPGQPRDRRKNEPRLAGCWARKCDAERQRAFEALSIFSMNEDDKIQTARATTRDNLETPPPRTPPVLRRLHPMVTGPMRMIRSNSKTCGLINRNWIRRINQIEAEAPPHRFGDGRSPRSGLQNAQSGSSPALSGLCELVADLGIVQNPSPPRPKNLKKSHG